jgi:hypothetical protein
MIASTESTSTTSILDEHRSSPGLLLALLGHEAMRRLRAAHTAHLIHELERLAAVAPNSGRAAVAKASAIRELLRLQGESVLSGPEERLWDEERDPNEQVDALDWHPTPELPLAERDASDTVGTRRRWWLALAAGRSRRGPSGLIARRAQARSGILASVAIGLLALTVGGLVAMMAALSLGLGWLAVIILPFWIAGLIWTERVKNAGIRAARDQCRRES